MSTARNIYRILRSIIFTAISLIAAIYLFLYVALSLPFVQNKITVIAERELSALVKSEVSIDRIEISPFNEAVVRGLDVKDQSGKICLSVEKTGAGIDLSRLIFRQQIVITYAELVGVDIRVSQARPDKPLNIQFLIDAFASKDKNKPPTRFDLALHSVVIRRCNASFDKEWLPLGEKGKIDFNHLYVRDLKADVDLPRLSNDDYKIDLRRLSLSGPAGLDIRTLSFKAHITPQSISVADFILKLPGSDIRPADFSLTFDSFPKIGETLRSGQLQFTTVDSRLTPSDFAWLLPQLTSCRFPLLVSAQLSGNLSGINADRLSIRTESTDDLLLELSGQAHALLDFKDKGLLNVESMKLNAASSFIRDNVALFTHLPELADNILSESGYVKILSSGSYDASLHTASGEIDLSSPIGAIHLVGDADLRNKQAVGFKASVIAEDIELGRILSKSGFGPASFEADASGRIGKSIIDGEGAISLHSLSFRGNEFSGVTASVAKNGNHISANVESEDPDAAIDMMADITLAGADSHISFSSNIERFVPGMFGLLPQYPGYVVSGSFNGDFSGNSPDNLLGTLDASNLSFAGDGPKGSVSLASLGVDLSMVSDSEKSIKISSDFIDASMKGDFRLSSLLGEFRNALSHVIPGFVTPISGVDMKSWGEFSVMLRPCDRLLEFFNVPVRILVPTPIEGSFDMASMTASLKLDMPYLQQGRDKLVRETYLTADIDGMSSAGLLRLHTLYPSKKGDAELDLDVTSSGGNLKADIGWTIEKMKGFSGLLSLSLKNQRHMLDGRREFDMKINPTKFTLSGADWDIGEASIMYSGKRIEVSDFRLWHDNQFISISGVASDSELDAVDISLADIDLGFIFDTLNINYVTFGGIATGELGASGVFTTSPVASTKTLEVKNLSYNDCVIGDGVIRSRWVNDEKEVEIKADILSDSRRVATIDGGIWLGADSLNFQINADKVNVGFLKPFMSAFTSDVGGRASGWANLYGNFHDIDLQGRLFADSVGMKVDYTNVYYHGTDSVSIDPGRIDIPGFILRDCYGHTAVLSGWLTHNYFHEPRFEFKISDADRLLCYDTNASINPVWYGRIFGNGGGVLRGWPGGVAIDVEMATAPESNFTFVISDEQEVGEYNFLTFSDRKKEANTPAPVDTVPDIVKSFQKKIEEEMNIPSLFSLNLFGNITPDALLTIVMDPQAGDKITARGDGPMQISYDSESDNLSMYGKYTLAEGKYNFTLQDLILRDFSIRPGSSISFNGNPLHANLDIMAAYRVNTNLSDLDESFSYDPELNRTNVPVDAMLAISGEMDHPDISFDIELPTLTSDVARKVKSIISTDDMMNRQVLYLLALNRFYTPEYMTNSGNGGELASVASSTLSSQLSRIMGQLTDKVTLAPSFRSDKGDFSDFEMDLALSSRLLNNRLLLNGNFGYRDRSASSTTFIGDFDIEYLLNRTGNLRLKAYNHFNDQNYYLKSSLTTQGIGITYRKDFDNPFTFLRKRKKNPLLPASTAAKQDESETLESEEKKSDKK